MEGFPGGSDGKETACNAEDLGSILGLGRSPGGGQGNPLQYFACRIRMDRGPWRAAVCGTAKSWTQLSNYTQHRGLNVPTGFGFCEHLHSLLRY